MSNGYVIFSQGKKPPYFPTFGMCREVAKPEYGKHNTRCLRLNNQSAYVQI